MESKTTPNIYTPETKQVLELIRGKTTYQTLGKNHNTKKSQFELNHLLTVSEKDLLAYGKKLELTLGNLNYLETNLLRLLSGRYTYNPSYKHIKSYIGENSYLL